MPSRKARRARHLPDGRHVATVCTDELIINGIMYCQQGNVSTKVVDDELARRLAPKARAYKPGYVSFSGGAKGRAVFAAIAQDLKKATRPEQPSRVKDARKDQKKQGPTP